MYVFIINPHSCCGKGERIWKKLKKLLEQKEVSYESYLTRQPGDARIYAKNLTENRQDAKVIVAVGGDGTLNEVLDGLCFDHPVTLGYIPAGSGNDFARSLRLSASPRRALKRILTSPYYQLLDYGVLTYGNQAEHRRFAVSAGIGLDGAVCSCIHDSPLGRLLNHFHLERFSSILLGIVQLFWAKPVKGYIVLDRVKKIEFNHIYFMSAHIHPYEGGGFRLAPGADGSDGKLSVCVVSHGSKRRLLGTLVSALLYRGKAIRGIRRYECREVAFHVERNLPVHADGEICGIWEKLEAECIEKKIRLII